MNKFVIGQKYIFNEEMVSEHKILRGKIFTFTMVEQTMIGGYRYRFKDQYGSVLMIRAEHPSLKDLIPYVIPKLKEFILCLK